jgi:hypothetical protein
LKIYILGTYFGTSLTHEVFCKKYKTKILSFGGISKFSKLIVFGQIWARFDALAVAEAEILKTP